MKYVFVFGLCALFAVVEAADPVKDFYASLSRFKPEQANERAALAQAVKAANNEAPARWQRSIESRRNRLLTDLGKIVGPSSASAVAKLIIQKMGPKRGQAFEAAKKGNAAAVTNLLADIKPLWNDPLQALGDKAEPLQQAIALVQEMDGYLRLYPGDYPEPVSAQKVKQDFAQLVRLACAPKGAGKIMAYNASLTYPSKLEKEQLRILNEYRMLPGTHPLEMDVRLYLASRDHSRDMKKEGFFSHDSPIKGKRSFGDRAKLFGYGAARGENIARGQSSAQQVHDAWYSSSGHHANMVGGHSQIGVGEAGYFWTQVFGSGGLLSSGKPPKDVQVMIEVLSLPTNASAEERFKVAQLAASAKLWKEAVEQLELVLKAEPNNEQAKKALDKIKQQM